MNESQRIALTIAEVAKMTGMSPDTLYRLVHSGELPAVRHGERGKLFIPRTAVEKLFRTELTTEPDRQLT